jgi:Domain of unknown function (DUF4189)
MSGRFFPVAQAALRRTGYFVVMLCIATMFSGVTAAPALATPVCGWDYAGIWVCVGTDTFTALAFSESDWSWGASWGALSRAQAEASALAQCRKYARDCKAQVWAVNGCAAWAVSDGDGHWGIGWNGFVDIAEARALGDCRRAGGRNCVVRAHPCADD